MDPDYRYELGTYETEEEARAACTRLIDAALAHLYQPGMSAEHLYRRYVLFGPDPFGVSEFSAWNYAKARCEVIAREQPIVAERSTEVAELRGLEEFVRTLGGDIEITA